MTLSALAELGSRVELVVSPAPRVSPNSTRWGSLGDTVNFSRLRFCHCSKLKMTDVSLSSFFCFIKKNLSNLILSNKYTQTVKWYVSQFCGKDKTGCDEGCFSVCFEKVGFGCHLLLWVPTLGSTTTFKF